MSKRTTTAETAGGHSIPGTGDALGNSESFLEFQERLSRVAPIHRPVLVIGERGTGKELAASRIHFLSKRWQGPLVALNCSALSPTLIESELFGYEKGAFTGAVQARTGRFEAAHGGTLFLDEVGAIPTEVQEKILRVVEYGIFERVGSSASTEADVRIVAATNADLVRLAAEGRFKQDLLDRLSFDVLLLPPLRDRKGDIALLAEHFAARMTFEIGRKEMPRFSREAMAALETYAWPGNVRELKNVVERAVYRSDSPLIEQIVFDPFQPAHPPKRTPATGPLPTEPFEPQDEDFMKVPLREALRRLEIKRVRQALTDSRYNQKQAAGMLGLSYDQFRGLYRKVRSAL